MVDRRLGLVGGENLVRSSVAILAVGRGRCACLVRLGVKAVRVRSLRIGVALHAGYLLRSRLVDQTFHILMTIHAPEHAAMDGVFELVPVDKEADFSAVLVIGQSGVGMTRKAVGVLQLVLGSRRTDSSDEEQDCRMEEYFPFNVHAMRRFHATQSRCD